MTVILFFDHSTGIGGAEISLLLLLRNINSEIFSSILVCPEGNLYKKANEYQLKVEILEIPRLNRSFSAIINLFRTSKSIKRLQQKYQADVIVSNTVRSSIYCFFAASIYAIPWVWYMRDFWLTESKPKFPFFDLALKRLLCSKANRVIVNSNATFRQLSNYGNIYCIHNGISFDHYPLTIKKTNFSEINSISPETIIIGTAGRLRPWKGQDRFLLMAKEIINRYQNVHFVIVGGDPFENTNNELIRLSRLTAELGINNYVTFTGHLEDIRPALNAMDIFVHPGDPEPFGLVVLEAMALQKPVIAFNHGALPEIIVHEKTGFLATPEDVNELANLAISLIVDPKKRIRFGEQGRLRVEKLFSIQKTVQQFEKIISEI